MNYQVASQPFWLKFSIKSEGVLVPWLQLGVSWRTINITLIFIAIILLKLFCSNLFQYFTLIRCSMSGNKHFLFYSILFLHPLLKATHMPPFLSNTNMSSGLPRFELLFSDLLRLEKSDFNGQLIGGRDICANLKTE